jgi:L,D-transpeptidase YbiS
MSTEATYSVEALAAKPARKGGFPWLAAGIILLGVLVLPSLAAGIGVWVRGEKRASEASRIVLAEAREFRARQRAGPPATGRKKGRRPGNRPAAPAAAPAGLPDQNVPLADLQAENLALQQRLDATFPQGLYIVIDTANNRFYLKNGHETLIDAVCSTGSYSRLDAPDGRSWFFHTPRGLFKVQGKIKNPTWVKPDWAFIEENEPIPSAHHPDRYDPYVMGDYALAFGNGYFIHGTLYQRLLGQGVTHGCVRLGDQALEQVYNTAPVGTPIFIY